MWNTILEKKSAHLAWRSLSRLVVLEASPLGTQSSYDQCRSGWDALLLPGGTTILPAWTSWSPTFMVSHIRVLFSDRKLMREECYGVQQSLKFLVLWWNCTYHVFGSIHLKHIKKSWLEWIRMGADVNNPFSLSKAVWTSENQQKSMFWSVNHVIGAMISENPLMKPGRS